MSIPLTSLHWEEYEAIEELAMAQMIEIKLPNGLIIAMLPNETSGGMMNLKAPKSLETNEQLWKRFIHALTTTDWNALGKVYSTAMPAPAPIQATVRPAPTVVPTVTKEQPAK